jgi:signal transduction histidine kinase
MKQKHRWLWLTFLIFFIGILAVLATRWNLTLLEKHGIQWEVVLGSIGFGIVIFGFVLFFTRLLQEMRLNQLQSEFLAAISHELRTPLATLGLTSNLLRNETLSEAESIKLWNSLEKELKRLRDEVDSLLEAARWDSKAVKVSRRLVNLEDWIQAQWPLWKERLGDPSELTRGGSPFPRQIKARIDPQLFKLIWVNLFENARKFAITQPKVKLSTSLLENGYWEMVIEDAGWGFYPQDAKKIFKRFFRGKTFAPYSIAGSGLGLFLVKSACERMRIDITAESAGLKQGARFRLRGRRYGHG